MPELITLQADVAGIAAAAPVELPDGYRIRATAPGDADELGGLYHHSYDAGLASGSPAEARADIRASFQGAYGSYWWEASPAIEWNSLIVASIMTVRRAPWDDVPDCPFVIELFTHREHRRLGLARHLVGRAAAEVEDGGDHALALRVGVDNAPARRLYESLGFVVAGTA